MEYKMEKGERTLFGDNYSIYINDVNVEELKNDSTYCISFPIDCDIQVASQILDGLNNYMKDHNRNIVFIATSDEMKIKEV